MSTAALREVRLYGPLGQQFGRLFRLAVATPAEAVQALCAVLPGFEKVFLGRDGKARYHVFVGRGERRRDIPEAEVDAPIGATDPIRLVPVVAGAKRAGVMQTIYGYVLYIAGGVATAYGYAALGSALISAGNAMMLSGVIALLSPQRTKTATAAANTPSYAFDGPVNNIEQGGPVPLLLGRVFTGSTVVSQAVSSDEIFIDTGPPPPTVGLPEWEPVYDPSAEGGG